MTSLFWVLKYNPQSEIHNPKSEILKPMPGIIVTSDGSHTIYLPEINEHYHSVHGAVQESEHIFLKAGFDTCKADPVNIFEVGFGTGLNALLTAARSLEGSREVFYTAVEKYPLDDEVMKLLNHRHYTGANGTQLADAIRMASWGKMTSICKNFNLLKKKADLLTEALEGSFDLIYFDAFGPDKQPDMWSREIFEKIAAVTSSGGILVTYSCKGEVKRILRAVGFIPEMLPGPPGKRHMMRAVKI